MRGSAGVGVGTVYRRFPDATLATRFRENAGLSQTLDDRGGGSSLGGATPRPLSATAGSTGSWGGLICRPAAGELIAGGLARGAQTPDGERDLEGLLRQLAPVV